MKVSELSGVGLDYWVAEAEGALRMTEGTMEFRLGGYSPSAKWREGGPIIERDQIAIVKFWDQSSCPGWSAHVGLVGPKEIYEQTGSTPLEAAMRAYVASKFGDTVPDLDEKSITKDGMHRI
jgi:hypothetical protein